MVVVGVTEAAVGVVAERQVVVVLVVEEEEAAEEVVEELKEVQTPSLNPTDILVFLLLKARTIRWLLKISSQANLYTARNGYLSKVVSKARKLNIVFGIHSVASWLLEFWVDWMIFSLNLVEKFFILVPRAERVSAMLLISLDLFVFFFVL